MAALLFAACASAGNDRQFATDVLHLGEVEAGFNVHAYYSSRDLTTPFLKVRVDQEEISEKVGLRVGLGGDVHLGVSLPYVSRECVTVNSGSCVNNRDDDEGFYNLRAWVKARLVGNDTSRFSLSALVLAEPNTSGRNSGPVYTGELAGGLRFTRAFRSSLTYAYVMPEDDRVTRIHSGLLGMELDASRYVTIVPSVVYRHYEPVQFASSENLYGVSLGVRNRVAGDTYLEPYVGYSKRTEVQLGCCARYEDTNSIWTGGLSMTHVFGRKRTESRAVPASPAPPAEPAPPPAVPAPAPAVPEAAPAPAPAPAPIAPAAAVLQPGSSVTPSHPVRLLSRPLPDAEANAALQAGSTVVLRNSVTNGTGTWWYVDSAGVPGWMREDDLR